MGVACVEVFPVSTQATVRTVPCPICLREVGSSVCPEKRTGFGGLVASLSPRTTTAPPLLPLAFPSRPLPFPPAQALVLLTLAPQSRSEPQDSVASCGTIQGSQNTSHGRSAHRTCLFLVSLQNHDIEQESVDDGGGNKGLSHCISPASLPRHTFTSRVKHKVRRPQLEGAE